MKEIRELVKLSKYAGERFDLIQAGGGNSSVKLDRDIMLVKTSGFALSEVELNKGYIRVKYKKVTGILKNKKLQSLKDKTARAKLAAGLLKKTVINSNHKPSIETFLHSLLYKYTFHTHPLVVSAVTSKKDWRKTLKFLFDNIALVDYYTPGAELAGGLKKEIDRYKEKYKEKPKIIFLQNHGLIVSSDNCKEVIKITEKVINKLENHLKVDMKKYKLTNKISALINSPKDNYLISYVSQDRDLNRFIKTRRKLFFTTPFCPDDLVYQGMEPLEIKRLKERKPFIKYRREFHSLPKVIIYKDYIFFIAQNIKKAKEIEETFKSHISVLGMGRGKTNFLDRKELLYLNNWDAEKYRRDKI